MKTYSSNTDFVIRAQIPRKAARYAELMAHAPAGDPNGTWLARLFASWSMGEGALPDYLGLEPEIFRALLDRFFPGVAVPGAAASGLRVDYTRMLEKDDLLDLLLNYANKPELPETAWIGNILVNGCMGSDHLWQDLGLWSRADLSGLIAHNFPELAVLNRNDMKWKKFFYKQLCDVEGISACRAPSCAVCVDYSNCFGPEE